MNSSLSSNFRSILDIFFKQLTELGSLTIITSIIIFTFFFDNTLALKLLIGIASVTIISFIIKAIFFRARPKKQLFNNIVEKLDASSFPSIHSARITILAFWLTMYSHELLLKIFLVAIGTLVAYSRIYLKKHYYADVIGGVTLGVIVNIIIYYIRIRI
jgi:undecaprenyl-diphosphatase